MWKPIRNFPNYEVSSNGEVRSTNYNHTGVCKILKPSISSNGYYGVILVKEGRRFYRAVHRLVAEAFLPNTNNLPYINHRDENKLNNKASNLEWCTTKYNIRYGSCIDRRANKQKVTRGNPIISIDNNGNEVKYISVKEASRITGINQGSISKCCKGERRIAGGFRWRYEQENQECHTE